MDYLTISQAAGELNLSPQRLRVILRGMFKRGALAPEQARKIGRDWILSPSFLDSLRSRPIQRGRPRKA